MQLAVRQNNQFVQPANPIIAVLAKYGANAHMWLPGVGAIDGILAKNWIDSAGTQAAAVGSHVGKVDDSGGGTVAAVQSVGANQPTLLKNAQNHYYWSFDVINSYLPLSAPVFQMSDDMCIVAGVSTNVANTSQTIFAQSNDSNNALPRLMIDDRGRPLLYVQGGAGAILNISGATSVVGAGGVVVSAAIRSSAVTLRLNGDQIASGTISGTYATATRSAIAAMPTLSQSLFLQGNVYPIIAIKGAVTDADMHILEQWVGSHL